MANITVIDSRMGSGKSTWAINYMNEHKDGRFIYCTPFVDETKRICDACTHFFMPTENRDMYGVMQYTKHNSFLNLLKEGNCISTTHQLFKTLQLTDTMSELVKQGGYTLILDEVIEVVEKIPATKDDLKDLKERVKIDDETHRVTWTQNNYKGNHHRLVKEIKTGNVILYRDNLLLWLFPEELLQMFDDVYILTFMFKSSYMEQYLRINNMTYSQYYVENGALIEGTQPLTQYKEYISKLIDVYDGKLNSCGDGKSKLSATWWKSRKKRREEEKNAVYNNAYNYGPVDKVIIPEQIPANMTHTRRRKQKKGGLNHPL